jgi:hypothetical protein
LLNSTGIVLVRAAGGRCPPSSRVRRTSTLVLIRLSYLIRNRDTTITAAIDTAFADAEIRITRTPV